MSDPVDPIDQANLDIVNEALQAFMESPIEDLAASGKVPELLAASLPRARQDVLRMYDWTCARSRVKPVEILWEDVAQTVPVINLTQFTHVFQAPSCIRIIDIVDSAMTPIDRRTEGQRIYTDEAAPIVLAILDLEDPTTWDPLLRSAIVYYLASKVVYAISGNTEAVQYLGQTAGGYIKMAKQQSLRDYRPGPAQADEWIPGLWEKRTV